MSVNAMNWAGLCRIPGAGDRARAVLDAVAWWAADAGDPNAARAFPPVEIPEGHAACWRGIAEIAERADADPRTVRRILKRFEAVGLIVRHRRHRVDGQLVRRISDVIVLNLAAEPVHVERDPAGVERRRKAAVEARARRLELAGQPGRGHDVLSPEEDTMSSDGRGHDVPSVAAAGGPPEEDMKPGRQGTSRSDRQRTQSPGVLQDTTHDTGQDTPSSRKPGTSPGLWTQPVDEDHRVAADPVASEQERRRIALTAMGNRRERKLPTGQSWRPLRELSPAAFDGGVERVLAELVDAEELDPDWWKGNRERHKDAWRQVRAEMLRQQVAAASPSAPTSAVEVA